MNRHMSEQKRTMIEVMIVIGLIGLIPLLVHISSHLERRLDIAPESAGLVLSRTSVEEAGELLSTAGFTADSSSAETAVVSYNGKEYVYNDSLISVLILGVDEPDTEEDVSLGVSGPADLLLLAVFDPAAGQYTLLHLHRDTMADIPVLDADGRYIGLTYEQLALSHTYGNNAATSCENSVYAVSRLLYGIPIQRYLALSADALPILNDLSGGVTVTVEDDFSGVDSTLIQGRSVTLTGDNVEHYVRARKGVETDPSDTSQMLRQKAYIRGLADALREKLSDDPAFLLEAYAAVAPSLVTDCTIDELADYAERFSDYTLSAIITPGGDAEMGEAFIQFYVSEEALQKMVIDVFYTPAVN